MASVPNNNYLWICVTLTVLGVGYQLFRRAATAPSPKTERARNQNEDLITKLAKLRITKKQLENDILKLRKEYVDFQDKHKVGVVRLEKCFNVVNQEVIGEGAGGHNQSQFRESWTVGELVHGVVSLSAWVDNQPSGNEEFKLEEQHPISKPKARPVKVKKCDEKIQPRISAFLEIETNQGPSVRTETKEENIIESNHQLREEVAKVRNLVADTVLHQRELHKNNKEKHIRKVLLAEEIRKIELKNKKLEVTQQNLNKWVRCLKKKREQSQEDADTLFPKREKSRLSGSWALLQNDSPGKRRPRLGSWSAQIKHIQRNTLNDLNSQERFTFGNSNMMASEDDDSKSVGSNASWGKARSEGMISLTNWETLADEDGDNSYLTTIKLPSARPEIVLSQSVPLLPSNKGDWDYSEPILL